MHWVGGGLSHFYESPLGWKTEKPSAVFLLEFSLYSVLKLKQLTAS